MRSSSLDKIIAMAVLAFIGSGLAGCACKCPPAESLRADAGDASAGDASTDAPDSLDIHSDGTAPDAPLASAGTGGTKAESTETPPANPPTSAKGDKDGAGCSPRGQLPLAYGAPAIAQKPRIDLSKGWRWGPGWPTGVETLAFGDTSGAEATVPGVTKTPSGKGKKTRVWLRKTFEVQRAAYFRTQGLDLGGRYGESVVYLNGQKLPPGPKNAPIYLKGSLPLVDGKNVVTIQLDYTKFVDGIFWYGTPALGKATERQRGAITRRYESKVDGKPHELSLYVPTCADLTVANPLIVALPGWGGTIHSYAGARLIAEAEKRGYLVLTPETFGNILYTDASEDGVMEALNLVMKDVNIDPHRVYITGLSMGGAGALQIGYHYPDRFAAVTAFYGDSEYDMRTGYIKRILGTPEQARRYSVIEFPENARNLPVLLVHAKDDRTSPFKQSSQLAKLDAKLGLENHRLIAPRKGGHTLATVDDHTTEAMDFFDAHRRNPMPTRVTFRTNSPRYQKAYWLKVETKGGEFVGVDASWDPKTRTVHIARIDGQPTALDFDVPAAKVTLERASTVPLRVQGKSVGAP